MYDTFKYNFDNLIKIVDVLLSENGCPWDREQTHETLITYMREECEEAVSAIQNNDMENLCEELGDVLLQVVFHAKLAEEEGFFNINDVTDSISRKMVSRHKHVFGDKAEKLTTGKEVEISWERIKEEEKAEKEIKKRNLLKN